MTTTRVCVAHLADLDPPGRLADWLVEAGAEVDVIRPGALPVDPAAYAGVVVLGGPMGVHDTADHPWLKEVRALMSTCVSKRIPLLAICLGAQLLAVAEGGEVQPGDEGPEVGRGLTAKRDVSWTDPLCADLPLMQDVVHFHQDVIARLPVGAELLLSATRYPTQAFRVGSCAYGVQFHIETTPEVFRHWLEVYPGFARWAHPADTTDEGIAKLHADTEEVWRPFVDRFVAMAAGELAPVAKNLL
ncbi:type 1 glutamine amidotransferase [Actinokineospora pegani]|uniref:type 1 glutamine amidotransferase n=1 Tax=Actinokineospora pegani TaxID=2654637 RepID=UPI0012E9A47F|nr:type 1 glutamine amidotransferase [Actinokineospora pegani]